MGTSQTGTKILIATLAAAVLGLAIALFLATRSSDAPAPAQPARAAPTDERGGGFGRASMAPRGPVGPPAVARNELGQPLNEDGRPAGPPDKLARIRNRAIAPGDLPTTPPLFTDAAQRAQFKRWWVEELGRRMQIYQQLEPRPEYPDAAETQKLLDAYYDAAEPRAPGESVESALARRQTWRTLWQRFLDDYGATVYTMSSRGGDPQYGQTPAPPVQPPGAEDPGDVPPALEAPLTPPGRSTDEPGGTDPIREEGADRAPRN